MYSYQKMGCNLKPNSSKKSIGNKWKTFRRVLLLTRKSGGRICVEIASLHIIILL